MSKRHHPTDEKRHRGRDEAPRSHSRGVGSSSGLTSRRETSQNSSSTTQARASDRASQRRAPQGEASRNSEFATQPYGGGGEDRAETSEWVSPSQPFGPTASMASMSILSSGFTPTVTPTTNASLPTVLVSTGPPPRPEGLRDKEHCGSCDAIGETGDVPLEWWKVEHLRNNKACRMAYRLGTCNWERSDVEIEAQKVADQAFRETVTSGGPKDPRGPTQTNAPQTTSTSVWSQGASQPPTQRQIVNPAYSNLQSNNPSTFYNQSAGYAAPTGQTSNTGYAASSYAPQPAPHYSSNTGYIAPSYMLPPPVPSYPSNAASTSYNPPPGRIRTGLSPPGQAPATGYPPPPAHHISYNIPYNTQPQATHQPALNDPPQGEQYASATSGLQQGSSHRGSSGHSHNHSQSRGSSRRDNRPKK
ncbi:hypothetical protein BOTNAR_0219g00140 [Botryotinia narcissicola]|uniref:Uncharacterized protein n=1 Tax=Botryotinia narcissicola TaxID=278944 RepID=A0A4Z1I586_9HELO|nr:hypothetical protein BOTNAR_0219g00140 [Botryotinia narcissicola]